MWRSVEEGLGLFVLKYKPRVPEQSLLNIVRALGYLDDLDDDPFLPMKRTDIEKYWRRRQPQIVRHIDTYGCIDLVA